MIYKVFIQGKDVGNIEANNTGHALAIVGKKIQDGEYVIDKSIPSSIKVQPVRE